MLTSQPLPRRSTVTHTNVRRRGVAAILAMMFLVIFGLCLAFAGSKASLPPFWALSTQFLKGSAAAGGIALINSVGNLGGFFGPSLVGVIKDKTGSNFGGLVLLGACYVGVALLAFAIPAKTRRQVTRPSD